MPDEKIRKEFVESQRPLEAPLEPTAKLKQVMADLESITSRLMPVAQAYLRRVQQEIHDEATEAVWSAAVDIFDELASVVARGEAIAPDLPIWTEYRRRIDQVEALELLALQKPREKPKA